MSILNTRIYIYSPPPIFQQLMFQHLFYSEQNYKQVFEFHTIAKLIHQVATGDVTFNNNLI